ncbi:LemA family protein [Candidatus Shapirobacteria bacterium]|nr:LemA family protein [Candidatus Shapirobacteria bacterium]
MFIPILVVLGVIVFYFFGTYNRFQTIKTRIKASVQEIGNQLKRQVELIPNLANSVDKYLKHEKNIIKALADARKIVSEAVGSGSTDKMLKAQDMVQKLLGSIKIVVESNPQLQAEKVVSKLMEDLRDTSDKIMYARRTLIDLSADYNRMVVTVPSNLVAKIFSFKEEKGLATPLEGSHLEVSKEDLKTPEIK